jgi:thiol-disulfide isomerase/thioredoxin
MLRLQRLAALLLLLLPCEVRAEAPALRLLDFSGRPVALADVQRDATLVAFWMASCVPCIEEMPLLDALSQRAASEPRVAVIGINLDDEESLPLARKVLAEKSVSYPMLRDPQRELVKKWFPKDPDSLGVPTLLLFDRAAHGVYSQGFRPGTSAETFIAEWWPQIAAALAGGLREPLRLLTPQNKATAMRPEQLAAFVEKMLRSKHPKLSAAAIKKRVDALTKEFARSGRIEID